jgi:8-hydroxy-5-deazaflavin:NADPH oxidoreductase
MDIAVLGSGRMVRGLAGRWAEAGHRISIAGRTPENVQACVDQVGSGARASTYSDAVRGAQVVLVAVRSDAWESVIESAGGPSAFADKVVIDISGPPGQRAMERASLDQDIYTGDGPSLAEQLQSLLPDAHVVKAFNMNPWLTWMIAGVDRPAGLIAVPICGDQTAAKEIIARIVDQMGCVPLDTGPLVRARNFESEAALYIHMMQLGYDVDLLFNRVTYAPPVPADAPSPHPAP